MDPFTIAAMAAQAGYGLYRGIKAQRGLRALQKQRMPSLMEAMGPLQESRRLYQQQYRQGLTPATRNLAQQQFAATQLGQQRAASDLSGGQMSSALSRLGALNTGQFALGLGAQNEAAQRAGMAGMVNMNQAISGLQRADAAQRLQQRLQMEQAYGQAMQQGFQDVLGAASGLATAQMAANEAEKQRQLYRDLYGEGNRTPNASVSTAISSIPSMGLSQMSRNTNPLTPIGPISVGRMSTPAATPSPFSTGSAMPEGIAPDLNGPVTILPTPSYETFMGRPFDPYGPYGGYGGYDLGIPPLRTKYSTPKTRFR
jgi:hypothetical protein